ncbi:hypothetical protein DB30_07881 [Enhygromyxa salina]|uniref:Uncharacterized protein n=1 Tax=Enhygromyxa salina TaxID=215803 RepID=A0A0C1ZRP1_9BACT|nr:hypothetical protein DB30_07881 [Enhygromyxa salina]
MDHGMSLDPARQEPQQSGFVIGGKQTEPDPLDHLVGPAASSKVFEEVVP